MVPYTFLSFVGFIWEEVSPVGKIQAFKQTPPSGKISEQLR